MKTAMMLKHADRKNWEDLFALANKGLLLADRPVWRFSLFHRLEQMQNW